MPRRPVSTTPLHLAVLAELVSYLSGSQRDDLVRKLDKLYPEWVFYAVDPLYLLDPTEKAIFRLLCQGYSNKEMATKLKMNQSTMQSIMPRIYQKLDVRDRVSVVLWAYERKIKLGKPIKRSGDTN